MQKRRTKTHIPSFLQKQKIKNRNPVIPAQAGIQSCRCGNLSGKTVSLDFTF
ncbi:pilin [Neisseria meningitidis]|uniref:Sporulation-specific protein n=1 Tax=Neisseria meningitidis alpha275 TaxID=295996 RepID=C6SL89_NEIME|nr:pilin [Neisseria meningitidis]CBA08898.1 sporulation-specific protein [Neisseria meningitidis alpha275]MBQ5162006.1 pilin [Neisseria meningitidis]MBQ5201255.1 pilin [Neisseria meningitidis]MBR7217006.1 pilin [Neisseria meningitidis]